jgi:hypothetical protein
MIDTLSGNNLDPCQEIQSGLYDLFSFPNRDKSKREFVFSIPCRNLVTLCKCRVVENGVQKVIQAAAESHNGLADMDQLRSPGSDRMHAKQMF